MTTTKSLTMYVSGVTVSLNGFEALIKECFKITVHDVTEEEYKAMKRDAAGEAIWEENTLKALCALFEKQQPVIAKRLHLDPDQVLEWNNHECWSCC